MLKTRIKPRLASRATPGSHDGMTKPSHGVIASSNDMWCGPPHPGTTVEVTQYGNPDLASRKICHSPSTKKSLGASSRRDLGRPIVWSTRLIREHKSALFPVLPRGFPLRSLVIHPWMTKHDLPQCGPDLLISPVFTEDIRCVLRPH